MIVLCTIVVCCLSLLASPGTKTSFLLASPASPRPATTTGSSDPTTDEWPMFRGELNHTDMATTTAVTGTGLKWNYTTGFDVYSSPAVSGGYLYVGGEDENIYCLNAANGDYVWSYTTKGIVDSSPAVSGGYVYFESADQNVYCLTTAGAFVWSYANGSYVQQSSPAVAGGYVYVGSGDNNLYCLNAGTGKLVWQFTTGDGVESCPGVANGYVYVGSLDYNIYCFPMIMPSGSISTSSTPKLTPGFSVELILLGLGIGILGMVEITLRKFRLKI